MSTKTIALENRVYEKLAAQKGEGESFTRVIDRLVESHSGGATCADAVRQAAALWRHKAPRREAEAMDRIVKSNRKRVDWSVEIPK